MNPDNGLKPADAHASVTDAETDPPPRTMLSFTSPFPDAPGTVHLIPTQPLPPNDRTAAGLYATESWGPFILDTHGMRHLYFDLAAVQSSMRLEEPDVLVTAYAQKMMSFLLFNRAPRDILLIGLGGGSLVKFCHHHLRTTRLTVVEVDPDIVGLRKWFHIPPDDERLNVILADGAEFVRHGEWTADVLLIDAFDRSGVAPSLASADFYTRAFRCLSPSGMLVMNLAGDRARYDAHLQMLREACPGPVRLVPVADDGNVLIFAFVQAAASWTLESLEKAAQELQLELALEFPRFLRRLREGHPL